MHGAAPQASSRPSLVSPVGSFSSRRTLSPPLSPSSSTTSSGSRLHSDRHEHTIDVKERRRAFSLAKKGTPGLGELLEILKGGIVPMWAVNSKGETLLHVAAKAGHSKVCFKLASGGLDADAMDAKGRTAAEVAKEDVVKDAISKGASKRRERLAQMGAAGGSMMVSRERSRGRVSNRGARWAGYRPRRWLACRPRRRKRLV